MPSLLYGTGVRLMECVRLRVKDVDFAARQITVRDGKGGKDRVAMLPDALGGVLRDRLAVVKAQHAAELAQGLGSVWLPDALARKYPNAATAWGWQYVFPARSISVDPRGGERRRHHVDEKLLQRAIRRAAGEAGIVKPVSPHVLRHYLPFLTMSGVMDEHAGAFDNCWPQHRHAQPITRHSSLKAKGYSGSREVGPQAYSALACCAEEMSSQGLAPSSRASHPDKFAWSLPIHVRATRQSPHDRHLLGGGPWPWCVSSGEQ